MENLPGLLIAVMFLSLGCLLVFGAHRRWNWLVDPPLEYWTVYSQAFLKKFFGPRFGIIFTHALGGLIIVLSVIGIMNGLRFL